MQQEKRKELPKKEFSKDYQLISKKKPCRQEVFKVMKSKDLQPRLLYPAKLSLRMEEHIKCLPDKVKLKEVIITISLLHEMLKGLI